MDTTTPLILLVEDSRTQALQICGVLQGAGWSVRHAATADQALEFLERHTPGLVLIDYYLPGLRGDELCRHIRARTQTRLVPIVLLTDDAGQETELRGLESGADDFLPKSAEQEVLLARVRAQLARSPAAPATPPTCETDFREARILAVDDSATYLAYLVAELSPDFPNIQTASSGAEAVARLQSEPFDCVLIDLVMPEMDGIEACHRLAAQNAATDRSIVVLMLTAKEDTASLTAALEAGADDFVGKSSEIAVIKGRIRALLRRQFYEAEHRQRLSAELRARELEAEQQRLLKEAAEARSALVDDLEKTAAALRRSNEELQQFAYVASHDLQEPLRVIAGCVQLLERRYKDKLDGDATEFIELAVDGARRMKSLIQDLLAYSRVETYGQKLAETPMEEVLDIAMRNLKASIDESGAEIAHDPLPVVRGDRTQLVQLLQNLIGNAIKYRGQRPPRIRVGAERDGDRWRFSVQDNGIGIEPQHYERIFVIFQRLHRACDVPGTGIGLSIAKKIIERHHGTIAVTSTPGEGSTFTFTLPVAEPAVAAEAAPALSAA